MTIGRAAAPLETLVAEKAYGHYLRVREWAGRVTAFEPRSTARTADERRVASEPAPLWDATPEMIANLRAWAEPMGGGRAADYTDPVSGLAKALRRDLKRLVIQVGSDLFVPEPSVLGGFGSPTTLGPCNTETLKFFSALIALQDGAVLPELRSGRRRLVWEIGGGWGGFAYQFKTICPNVTYVITGSPAAFLVSAVYLMTTVSDARCRFYDASAGDVWTRWDEVDFIFVPEPVLVRPPRLDLVIDLMALARMTPQRVAHDVQQAFDAGCRYVYSLHRGNWLDGEMPPVWRALERCYWMHPVPARVELRKSSVDYSHAIGWRRRRV